MIIQIVFLPKKFVLHVRNKKACLCFGDKCTFIGQKALHDKCTLVGFLHYSARFDNLYICRFVNGTSFDPNPIWTRSVNIDTGLGLTTHVRPDTVTIRVGYDFITIRFGPDSINGFFCSVETWVCMLFVYHFGCLHVIFLHTPIGNLNFITTQFVW